MPAPNAPPEIGGIVHLDHVNFEVCGHDLATAFFVAGLGLARDPYRRVDETNMGVNVGLQQFHLPRRGPTAPYPGTVGLVLPDLAGRRARLDRLAAAGRFDGLPFVWEGDDATAEVLSPWGVRLRLHATGTVPFSKPLGIAYVELPVPADTLAAIGRFYADVFGAIVRADAIAGAPATIVNVGPWQTLRFVGGAAAAPPLDRHHVSFHATHYEAACARLRRAGALPADEAGCVVFCRHIFDPRDDARVLGLVNEVRSLYHPDFMRPLVNRWPMDDEPFTEIGAVPAETVAARDRVGP